MNYLFDYLQTAREKFGDKDAVVCGDVRLTFDDLYNCSLVLSSEIMRRGIRNEPVFVYLPKSEKSIIAIMGILASGNFYTPTDVKFPLEKPQRIVDGLCPALAVTDQKNLDKCKCLGLSESQIINIDDLRKSGEQMAVYSKAIADTTSEDLAYVLFTSGSTGKPKGVMISRGAVKDYIDWASECFHVTEVDNICNQAPFYFDNSTLDIYLMAKCGATLHIVPESYYAFPAKLCSYLAENMITTIFWVPSVFQSFQRFDLLREISNLSLNKILFAGEVMHNRELNYWRKYFPDALFANLYGPTEITVDCTYYIVDRNYTDDESLPIGKARKNMEVMLLDSTDHLITESDRQGEICVRGYAVSKGYWKDTEKTAKVFVQNPLNDRYAEKIYRTGDVAHYSSDGQLMFDGRLDNQIKHRGSRIELGEVENMCLNLRYIQQVCAVYDQDKDEIILFTVLSESHDERSVIKDLRTVLPGYMMPENVHVMDSIPLNDNGKYDRKQLKQMIR